MRNNQDASSGTGSSRNDRTSVSSITEINTNKRGSRSKRNNNNNNNKHTVAGIIDFTGDSTEMNGHVFQVHGEQIKRGQFQDTLDMLRVYASKCMKKDINILNPLFT